MLRRDRARDGLARRSARLRLFRGRAGRTRSHEGIYVPENMPKIAIASMQPREILIVIVITNVAIIMPIESVIKRLPTSSKREANGSVVQKSPDQRG